MVNTGDLQHLCVCVHLKNPNVCSTWTSWSTKLCTHNKLQMNKLSIRLNPTTFPSSIPVSVERTTPVLVPDPSPSTPSFKYVHYGPTDNEAGQDREILSQTRGSPPTSPVSVRHPAARPTTMSSPSCAGVTRGGQWAGHQWGPGPTWNVLTDRNDIKWIYQQVDSGSSAG